MPWKDFQDSLPHVEADFDGDGKPDLVQVFAKREDEGARVVAFRLSASAEVFHFPFDPNSYDIAVKNNVLIIGGCFGNGRWCKTLKFRYDKSLHTIRLIGYEEESFGNALHEGAYVKSINLLTGQMEIEGNGISKKRKRLIFKPTTIRNFQARDLDKLEAAGREFLQN